MPYNVLLYPIRECGELLWSKEQLMKKAIVQATFLRDDIHQWHLNRALVPQPYIAEPTFTEESFPSANMGAGATLAVVEGWLGYRFTNPGDALLFKLTFGGEA